MKLTLLMMFAALAATGLPALAQETTIDQGKVYVSDPAGCDMIESQGTFAYFETGGLAMSFPQGIQGYEYHCEFFDIKSRDDTFGWLLVDAICEEPGIRWPDMLSITPSTEDSVEVVSMDSDSGPESYTRCDALSELPNG